MFPVAVLRPRATLLPGLVAAAVALVVAVLLHAGPATHHAPARSATETLNAIPLAFERNSGQAPAAVRFFARAPGYALALDDHGSQLRLAGRHGSDATLSTRFAGAGHPVVSGIGAQAGRVNYLIGSQPSDWHTGVRTYDSVRYHGVWPGIDVLFHGNRGALEYDYEIAPGADASRIAQHLSGARSLRVDRAGDLVIALSGGTLRELAPTAFQVSGGHRRAVASRFVLSGRTVRIALGDYDHSRALTIDPTYATATYFGGSNNDGASSTAVDAGGNTYVAGSTYSTNFPVKGAAQGTEGGDEDAYVAKLSPSGTLVYATYIGGSGTDSGNAIALGGDGSTYVTGTTTSTNLPTKTPYQSTNKGNTDAFVAKLAPSGSTIDYLTYLGGTQTDIPNGIGVDSHGNAFVGGQTESTDFPTAGGLPSYPGDGYKNGFVAELGPTGATLPHAGYIGGNHDDEVYGVAVDASDRVYLSGETWSSNFPTTSDALQPAQAGDPYATDAFVTRLDDDGGTVGYSTYFGGTNSDGGRGIAVDNHENAYIVGYSVSTDLPDTTGSVQPANAGGNGYDAMVAKIPTSGTGSPWATYLGGSYFDDGAGIGLTPDGDVWVDGFTGSSNFPTTTNAAQPTAPGTATDGNGFLANISGDGKTLITSTYLGGSTSGSSDSANGLAVGPNGDVAAVGGTSASDFPTTSNAMDKTLGGQQDGFIVTIASARRSSATSVDCGDSATVGVAATCTVTVADSGSGAIAPTGTVTVSNTGLGDIPDPGQCTLVAGGTSATCTVTYTPADATPATITASYAGDTKHNASSGTVDVTAAKRATTTAIDCGDKVTIGVDATCTVTVTDGGDGTKSMPTGKVTVTRTGAGAVTGSPCTLGGTGDSSTCTVTYTAADATAATITASYPGDGKHAASSGHVAVTADKRSTSTDVDCGDDSRIDVALICKATVTDTGEGTSSLPDDDVTFDSDGDGRFSSDSCSLDTNDPPTCTVTYTPSSAGAQKITASYGGDAKHDESNGTTDLSVDGRPTSTTLACPATLAAGVAGTCTATVADTGDGQLTDPAGDVTFTTSGSGTFSASGKCTLATDPTSTKCSVTYTPGAAGTETLTASYAGGGVHSESSGTRQLTVTKRSTTTKLACGSALALHVAATCTATVTDTSATVTPAGKVNLATSGNGTFSASSCTLGGSGASATCTAQYTPTAAGSETLTGSYVGDAASTASSGTTTIDAEPRATTTSLGCGSSSTIGVAASCTVSVSDTGSGTAIAPTGKVTFASSGTGAYSPASCTLTGSGATTTCTTSYAPGAAGAATLTASYGGDGPHTASSGTASLTPALRGTSTNVVCTSPATVGVATPCTATVSDTSPGAATPPTGQLSFGSSAPGAFGTPVCSSSANDATGTCTLTFTPSQNGTATISVSYAGDPAHTTSSSSVDIAVPAPSSGDGGGDTPPTSTPTTTAAAPTTPAPSATPTPTPTTPTVVGTIPTPPALVLSKLKLPGKFHAADGATVSFSLTAAASVRFTVTQAASGRKVGKSCVKPTKQNKKASSCTRQVEVDGSVTVTGKAGANTAKFSGRLGGKTLKAGDYELTATPFTPGGEGKADTAKFKIAD